MMMLLYLVMGLHLVRLHFVVVWRMLVGLEHHVVLMLVPTVRALVRELGLVVVILSGGFVTLFPFAATVLEPDLRMNEIKNSLNNVCLQTIENTLENGSIEALAHMTSSSENNSSDALRNIKHVNMIHFVCSKHIH